jgi:hypothetical protein
LGKECKGIWISIELCREKELTWMEKMFFTKIDSLNNDKGCFASNKFFASFFNLSVSRSSEVINSLIKKDYIKARYKKEGKEIKERVLEISNRGIRFSKGGYSENAEESNIVIKNTIIDILSVWNEKEILITHTNKAIERNIKKRHEDVVKEIGSDEVCRAIENYASVLISDEYYFSYKWSLWDFLARGVDKFLDAADPFSNYRREGASEPKFLDASTVPRRKPGEL